MKVTGGDAHNVMPSRHVTLTVLVVANANHCTVRFEANGMPIA